MLLPYKDKRTRYNNMRIAEGVPVASVTKLGIDVEDDCLAAHGPKSLVQTFNRAMRDQIERDLLLPVCNVLHSINSQADDGSVRFGAEKMDVIGWHLFDRAAQISGSLISMWCSVQLVELYNGFLDGKPLCRSNEVAETLDRALSGFLDRALSGFDVNRQQQNTSLTPQPKDKADELNEKLRSEIAILLREQKRLSFHKQSYPPAIKPLKGLR